MSMVECHDGLVPTRVFDERSGVLEVSVGSADSCGGRVEPGRKQQRRQPACSIMTDGPPQPMRINRSNGNLFRCFIVGLNSFPTARNTFPRLRGDFHSYGWTLRGRTGSCFLLPPAPVLPWRRHTAGPRRAWTSRPLVTATVTSRDPPGGL